MCFLPAKKFKKPLLFRLSAQIGAVYLTMAFLKNNQYIRVLKESTLPELHRAQFDSNQRMKNRAF